ncbi:gag/pol protein [Cucumis melo var. makuwa]|uniref:Gag/pol protein n=1 Tax=Cucumis melo var. makuwa TaxID=1194695 RepID=A0A5D3BR38_CUCMM|nr:gag/pol protein [Cucumis melo var. makuwa]
MRHIPYASVIRSLMYEMLCTKPDICYATDRDSRKSVSSSVFTLNEGATVWRSIKQGCIVDSTMEAKCVAACEDAKDEAMANSKEPISHKRENHIERKYHLIREIMH